MKKWMPLLVALMVLAVPAPAMAAEGGGPGGQAGQVRQYAYMELEGQPEAVQEKILEARKEIIYQHSWVADGLSGWVVDGQTGAVKEILPQFSELFPGWEVPQEDAMASAPSIPLPEAPPPVVEPLASRLINGMRAIYSGRVCLGKATSSNAPYFHTQA